MKVVAISGASGFIGQQLTRRFQKNKWRVWEITRDVLYDINLLKEGLYHIKPSLIIACHSYGNMYHQKDIPETIQANIIATYKLLEATKNIDYRHFIFLSSLAVYGKSDTKMVETDMTKPETIYAITKKTAEDMCLMYKKNYNKSVIIARLGSVYGPGEIDYRLIPIIINSIVKKRVFDLDLNAIHSWIYINDLIDAIVMFSHMAHISSSIVNVSGQDNKKNIDIMKILEKNGPAFHKPADNLRKDHSRTMRADNTYLRNLGWKQKTTIEEGLQKTYEWYEKIYNRQTNGRS